jgi:transcriptional regulator with XRE-family HTH domain
MTKEELKNLRTLCGWSQEEAARRCGVSLSWWRRRESGEQPIPDAYETYFRLKAREFGRDLTNCIDRESNWSASAIKELRGARGMSQAQFADAVGVSKLTVTRWENRQAVPNETNVHRLDKIKVG